MSLRLLTSLRTKPPLLGNKKKPGRFLVMRNPYEILALSEEATEQEIKRAYATLIKRFTPEENPEKFMLQYETVVSS